MANAFDQFDTPAAESNPFDQFDAPSPKQDNPLVRGFKHAVSSGKTAAALATGDYDDAAALAAERDTYAKNNPGSKEGNELMQAWESGDGIMGGIKGVAGEFSKDWKEAPSTFDAVRETGKNVAAMGGGIVEQVPNMVMPMAGMVVGGAIGSAAAPGAGTVAGAFGGATLGNAAAESAEQVDRSLREAQIDPQDTESVRAHLEQNGGKIAGQTLTKGAIIGVADTLSAGAGHLLLAGPGKAAANRALADMGVNVADKAAVKSAMESADFGTRLANDATYQATRTGANRAARNVGAFATEPAGEFAGEYFGQGVATGDWDEKGAALEALSSIGQSGITFAGQKFVEYVTRPKTGEKTEKPSNPLLALPSPTYTGTPSDQLLMSQVERQRQIDEADANAQSLYEARAAYDAAQQELKSIRLTTDPAPLQQRIDELLGVGKKALPKSAQAEYQKSLVEALNEPVGITHDADGREIPLTIGAYLDAQVEVADKQRMLDAAETMTRAGQESQTRLNQLADEETQTQPDIPVVGPLSAAAKQAVDSGVATYVQTRKALEDAPKPIDGGESNGRQPSARENAGMATSGAQEGRVELPGSGNVLAPAPSGDADPIVSRAEVAASGVRPAVSAGVAVDGGVTPPAQSPVRPYKEGQARMMAARLTRQGLPSESYPHPTQPGMFAIRPLGENNAEPRPQPAPPASQEPATEPAATVAPVQTAETEAQQAPVEVKPAGVNPIMRRDDLVGAIMRSIGGRGIHSDMAQTLTGDTANRVTKLRGLFTNQGQQDMDDLAMLLREEEGYAIRDGAQLEEMIREAAGGNVAVSMARQERDAAEAQEKQYRDSIRKKAKKYGFKTVAVKFSELEKIVLARLEERHNQAVAILDEKSMNRFNAALEEVTAVLPEEAVDATLTEVNQRGFHAREFWNEATRILRGMVYDAKQEAANGTNPEEVGDGRGNRATGGGTPVDQRNQAPAEQATAEPTATTEEERPGLALQGQTPAEIRAQEAQRQAEEARANRPEPDKSPTVKADQVDLFNTQGGLFNSNRDSVSTADLPSVETASAPVASTEQAQPNMLPQRGEVGASLTKEQRKEVLKTLVDVYKANNAPKEFKGQDRNGNERYGYAHSPEFFVKSDITGAMVRYHVTLPDGRIAHPTELFADYTQSDIDAAMQQDEAAERQKQQADESRLETLKRRTADSLNEANRKFNTENRGRADYVPAILTNGKQFIRTSPESVRHDLELLGNGWGEQESVDAAAHEAATSPKNDTPEPTVAQKEAGNYKVGRVNISGLDISIENPEGSTRSGTDANGKQWSVTMQSHYGYIRKTEGSDGDHVDVFVKPGTAEDYAGNVFVIDQRKANGYFDEHKVMLGWPSEEEAKSAYLANYSKGWTGFGAITPMTMDELKAWVASGDQKNPLVPKTLTERVDSAKKKKQAENAERAKKFADLVAKRKAEKAAVRQSSASSDSTQNTTDRVPEWHTKLPNEGLPITEAQGKSGGYSRVPWVVAEDAYNAITRNQLMNGMPMYAYYLPAEGGRNGVVRLIPDDQNAPKPWKLLNGEAVRVFSQTKEQIVAKLAEWLRSAPILGDERSAAKEESATTQKEPWQMTRKEWYNAKNSDRAETFGSGGNRNGAQETEARIARKARLNYGVEETGEPVDHRQVIEKAIAEGKAVPEAVLADYPKLAKQHESKPDKVDDFGEKLGGARKDIARNLKDALEREFSDEELASQPLSKIWPKTDIDAIEDPFTAAFAYSARKEIPAKPRTSYKLKRWIGQVKTMRELAGRVLRIGEARIREMIKSEHQSLGSQFMPKVDLLMAIDRQSWSRIGEVSEHPTAYRYSDNSELIPSPYVAVRIDGKSNTFDVSSVGDVIDKVNALLGNAPTEKKMQFEVRGQGASFSINKKGDSEYRKLKTFETSKEALDFVRSNYADLVAAWDDVKKRYNVKESDVRNDENRPRTAKDWRNGKDISSEEFQEKFGFRGGQFGNWVSQGKGAKERQWMLNEAHDALMDLADILNIPPKAVSLNGSLGIAFGARGSGSASAHYESDSIVINLTKTKGAGTLAHEWFHALDNYFSRMRGGEAKINANALDAQAAYRANNYVTYRPEPMMVHKTQRSTPITKARLQQLREQNPSAGYLDPANWQEDPNHPQGVRPVVEKAFSDLVQALDASPMATRSRMNDKGTDGYWGRIIERGARAFENYVISKMMQSGYHNDYLANVRDVSDFPRSKERYPYLLQEEVAPIAEAFDNLFETVETKETETGISLYEESAVYTVNEPDEISGDISQGIENALPDPARKNSLRPEPVGAINRAEPRAVLAVREAPDAEGLYSVKAQLVTVGERQLPVASVNSPEDAARAFAHLTRFAVEHMDGLVTDKNGKPVAIIGALKGAPTQASVYPSTILMELSRIDGAANLWLSHNHPSGVSELSSADRRIADIFARTLKDTGVAFRGLSAMARVGDTVNWSDSDYNNGSIPAKEIAPHRVAIVEREIIESIPGAEISSAGEAKRLVAEIAKDKPGILFVTAQNQVASFVPFNPGEMGQLRSGDRLMRLFRAAARSGGSGAFVAMPDGRVLGSEFSNIKGALEQIDVRVLDGIEYSSDGTGVATSLAERGLDLSSGPDFFNQANDGLISPADKAIYGMAAEGKSATEILQFIAASSRNPFYRQLAKLLQKTGIATTITVGDSKGWKFNAGDGKYAAAYNPKTDTAALFRPAASERNVLHELVHAATLKALSKKGLATAQMNALFNHVKNTGKLKGMYGLSNVDEFVAEVFSNPKFQQALKAVSAPKGTRTIKSAWHWFIRVVRGILGIQQGQENALSRALEIGVEVMRENMLETKVGPAVPRTTSNDGVAHTSETSDGQPDSNIDDSGVRYNIADEGWTVSEPSKMDDVIYALQDKHIDTKRVLQSIMKTGKKIRDSANPYLQEELFHGRAAKGVNDFLDFELRPLLAEMQKSGVDMGDFEEYLWNRHAEERNAQIAKINPEMKDGGSGIKTTDAKAYLAGLSAEQKAKYESLSAKVDAINRNSQAILVSSGLEKQETIDAWNGAYKHYVPLQREDVDSGHVGTGKGYSVRGSSSKRAMGSGRAVVDIIANITMQRERNIVRAEKNRVSNALLGLAIENPNPDFWKVDEAPKERVVEEKAIYTVRDDEGNETEFTRMSDAEKFAKSLPGSEIEQTWGDRVTERVVPGFSTKDHVLLTRINGEDHYIIFNERDERAMRMVTALKNLDMDNLGRVLSTVGKATRYLASINTQYNPVFGVINLIRDAQGALLNLSSTPLAGEQKRVLGYTKDALVGIYKDIRAHRKGNKPSSNWATLFEEFQKEGGQTGYRDQYANAESRADAIRNELKQFKDGKAKQFTRGVFGWLSDYNETMENAVRLAAYKAAKEKGISNQQAASLAKNITVNFNRKGQMATQVGALYAFFNASVQGTARIAGTLFETNDGDLKTVRLSKVGKKIITGGIMLGSMQAMLLAAAGYDDDEPPDFVRERNLILPIGGGKYLTLAMPLGFHVLPGIGRIATEFVLSGGKDPMKRVAAFASMFADTFNPIGNAGFSLQSITPSVVDPFAALAENKDFTGKEIYREDFNSLNPQTGNARAKDVATFYSKWISSALNWITGGSEFKPGMFSPSPDSIDYLLGQLTGGVGRETNKVAQTIGSTVSGEDLPLYKIPLFGRFVGDTEGQSGHSAKFYDAIKQINMHEAEYKGLIKSGRAKEAREYMAENPAVRLIMAGNHVERQVSKLRSMKRDLVEKDADPARVREIDERITATMQKFNERAATVF